MRRLGSSWRGVRGVELRLRGGCEAKTRGRRRWGGGTSCGAGVEEDVGVRGKSCISRSLPVLYVSTSPIPPNSLVASSLTSFAAFRRTCRRTCNTRNVRLRTLYTLPLLRTKSLTFSLHLAGSSEARFPTGRVSKGVEGGIGLFTGKEKGKAQQEELYRVLKKEDCFRTTLNPVVEHTRRRQWRYRRSGPTSRDAPAT